MKAIDRRDSQLCRVHHIEATRVGIAALDQDCDDVFLTEGSCNVKPLDPSSRLVAADDAFRDPVVDGAHSRGH